LINPRASFVERMRLHQLAAGSDDAVVDYRDVLAKSIRLVVDTVTRINAAGLRDVGDGRHRRLGPPDLGGGGVAAPGERAPERPSSSSRCPPLEDAERLRSVVDAGRHNPGSDRGKRTSCAVGYG